jgi:hypothetical protein|nr:MAG TPA: hypothetical protein [Caudoviricetes sp.]
MSYGRLPKYAQKLLNGSPTTRSRSQKQESRIAKDLRGHTTINSGATFGQNDVFTDFCEVEAKTTNKESFSLKLSDWRKLRKKCSTTKIPIFVVDFETSKDSLAVLTYDDLLYLLDKINRAKP